MGFTTTSKIFVYWSAFCRYVVQMRAITPVAELSFFFCQPQPIPGKNTALSLRQADGQSAAGAGTVALSCLFDRALQRFTEPLYRGLTFGNRQ